MLAMVTTETLVVIFLNKHFGNKFFFLLSYSQANKEHIIVPLAGAGGRLAVLEVSRLHILVFVSCCFVA